MEFRKPSRTGSDPSEAVTAPSTPSQANAAQAAASRKTSKSRVQVQEELEAANPRERGFDPYNSGAFNIKDTWSRVNRKK